MRLQTADTLHQHKHDLCNQLVTADMPPRFSSHCLHALFTTCKISTTPLHTTWYATIPCVVSLPAREKKDKGHTFDKQIFFNQNAIVEGIQVNAVQWECAGNLIGAADFLWAAAVLHVLSKADCEKFVTSAHLLLKPGGTFYGWTVGNREAGDWHTTPDGKANRYLHSAVITLSILTALSVGPPACLPACLPSVNLSGYVTVRVSTCICFC